MKHEQIWAPWRLDYILGIDKEHEPNKGDLEILPGGDPECFICQGVADSNDRARYVVRRGHLTITILNRYPYNNGHLLVAPVTHRANLSDLSHEEQLELALEVTLIVDLLEKVIQPQGFNVGLNLGRVAGAGLPGHLHWHVVPRWNGDTNFMATLASVKVIPQSLDALWELLTLELKKKHPGA